MKCFRCNLAAPHNTLYRINQKGVKGIWACYNHRIEKDSELEAIVKTLEKEQKKCQP